MHIVMHSSQTTKPARSFDESTVRADTSRSLSQSCMAMRPLVESLEALKLVVSPHIEEIV